MNRPEKAASIHDTPEGEIQQTPAVSVSKSEHRFWHCLSPPFHQTSQNRWEGKGSELEQMLTQMETDPEKYNFTKLSY